MSNYYLAPETMRTMDPLELNSALVKEYVKPIPTSLETADELAHAGQLLGILSNQYSYMLAVLDTFKIYTKIANSGEKEEHEEMMMRRDTIAAITEILKQQYSSVSRLITVKKMINEELKMTDAV